MKHRLLPLAFVSIAFLSTSLQAAPLLGTFNIAGTITVTTSAITWMSNDPPFMLDKATIGPGPTGSFAGLGGTVATIDNLNSATEPVGTPFAATPFLSFDAAPALGLLDINFIFAGIYSTAQCTAAPAVGQTCTPNPPITPVTSPFNFVNNPGIMGPQATATFAFGGISADGQSQWSANFTSQFGVPFQSVLAMLASTGSVSNTYSATVTVTPVPEPEIWSLFIVGAALVLVSRLGVIRSRMGRG
ncbi:MAG TPA: hypothetical protein VMH81_27795 [Bryobacteraceae bacterium]|nr:hypothetical protein [Bryobacteraceae bacterium]HTS29717.1 hypothetical protein [Bryobacteraceae bacterium]